MPKKLKKKKKISKTSAYKRGRAFEYRVKKYYERLGFYVKRSYGSKGAEDLLAVRKHKDDNGIHLYHIQCKHNRRYIPLIKDEHIRLVELSIKTGGVAIHAFSDEKGHIKIKQLERNKYIIK